MDAQHAQQLLTEAKEETRLDRHAPHPHHTTTGIVTAPRTATASSLPSPTSAPSHPTQYDVLCWCLF